MMNILSKILLTVSNALLVPDIIFLLGFMALTIVYLGGLLGEFAERWQYARAFQGLVADLKKHPARKVQTKDVPARHGYPAQMFSRLIKGTAEKSVDDTQLVMEASLSRMIVGIRLGPVLGLAGTLIPLGPALMSISEGNVAALAQNLVVAFTTTVVGLFIGGVSYVIYSTRQRWYAQDINDLEFILKRLE